jgi:hypothetical protein
VKNDLLRIYSPPNRLAHGKEAVRRAKEGQTEEVWMNRFSQYVGIDRVTLSGLPCYILLSSYLTAPA